MSRVLSDQKRRTPRVSPLLEGEDTAAGKPTKTEQELRKDATTGLKIPTQKWP
jgi:hypothetical protein